MQKNIRQLLLLAALLFTVALPVVRAQNEIKYTSCPGCWNPDSLGNHRAVIHFSGTGNMARVIIPWRRRDHSPENKRIILQDAQTGKRILNATTGVITRESGELFFEPVSGAGDYYAYYMPYRNEGRSNYPKGVYLRSDTTASADWLSALASTAASITSVAAGPTLDAGRGVSRTVAIPVNCRVTGLQSIDDFNSFYPMELIATAKETSELKAKYPGKAFLVFPEDRLHSIRMRYDLPYRWIGGEQGGPGNRSVRRGADPAFQGEAARGEYYAYQLGVYALQGLEDVQLQFSDLASATGQKIAAGNISCINTTGITYDGKPFIKTVKVPQGQVQALWCGIDVPADALPGDYSGTVTVTAKIGSVTGTAGSSSGSGMQAGMVSAKPRVIHILLRVGNTLLKDGGAGEPWKMTRLKWLNSTLAQENTVIAPYTPLVVQGDTISLLGRKIQLSQQGFPEQIQTFFSPEMTGYSVAPNNLLGENIHFHFTRQADGKDIQLKSGGLSFILQQPGTVQWKATNTADELQMDVNASLEFDGFLAYTVKVTALQDIDLSEISMHIPFQQDMAKYMMGLGLKGGYRPDSTYLWKWEVATRNQDGAWIGNTNAGLQYSLRDEKYTRPLNTNFYLQKPLLLPSSWGNDGKGGITVGVKGKNVLVNNYSGARHLKKGDTLYYNFNLLITPFHPINTDFQWATRFYHSYQDLDSIKATGATVVNIHHATPINPWINYPFIEWRRMKGYIDTAHRLGLKVKIYNTIRELSDHAYETFALRSLGNEVYSQGPGGGFSWLQEHIGEDYIAAWFVPELKDAALVNSGMSRWHNYYVEGMNWLTQNVGIDGIYLDDVAFDRVTMKRIKRVLTQDGHPGIIDLHSANQYNKHDGFNNSANLYMEHFPYLNRLWFGEYFDYEKNTPDFFLTEVSGIPFGLMGEMLEGGGNPWRGLIYGMTNRMPWSDNADPRPIWKVWDEFGMQGTQMIGYWSPSCPIRTSDAKVLTTVYRKPGAALVSLASWADGDTTVQLTIDWQQLGIDPAKATITAPEMKNFQPGRVFRADEPIPVPKGKGWLLVIR
jgi:glycosyl hydrolase family 123